MNNDIRDFRDYLIFNRYEEICFLWVKSQELKNFEKLREDNDNLM